VKFRRRREGRTDYYLRKALVQSYKLRLVVRGSLRYMYAQIVEATPSGDRVIATASSRELKAYGWKTPSGNVPAAYLTGYLLGKKAQVAGIKTAVLDIGLANASPGSRVFATLKGALDSGLSVPYSAEALPEEDRIKGTHIASYAKQIGGMDPSMYGKVFSQYLKTNSRPEEIVDNFSKVKNMIDVAFEGG
jgi:large subunit ribosomal protein L18